MSKFVSKVGRWAFLCLHSTQCWSAFSVKGSIWWQLAGTTNPGFLEVASWRKWVAIFSYFLATKGISTYCKTANIFGICSASVCTRKFNFGYPIPSLDKSSSSGTKEYWLYIYTYKKTFFCESLGTYVLMSYFLLKKVENYLDNSVDIWWGEILYWIFKYPPSLF